MKADGNLARTAQGMEAMSSTRTRGTIGSALIFLTALGGAASCSSEGGGGSEAQAGAGGGGGTAGGGFECGDSGEIDLGGTFALFARLSLTFSSQPGGAVTVCPVDQTSEGSFLALVEVTHEQGQVAVQLSSVVCSLELPIISAVAGQCEANASNLVYAGLDFPPALIDAFPLASTATTTGDLSGLIAPANVGLGRLAFVIGTRERGDMMPTWLEEKVGCGLGDVDVGRTQACATECVSDCTTLSDDDGDGWPAATVGVCGRTEDDQRRNVPCNTEEPNVPGVTIQGRAMLNLQVDPLLQATAHSSCEVSGTLDANVRYNVVGADLYISNAQISVTSAIKSLPRYSLEPSLSRFRLVRVDGKYGSLDFGADFLQPLASCKTVIVRQNEIK